MKKLVQKVKKKNEEGARKKLIEELFYDFNQSRGQVYSTNFFRGVFFGVGSVVGGTLVVAILVWLLSLLTDIPGGIGEFIQFIVNNVEQSE